MQRRVRNCGEVRSGVSVSSAVGSADQSPKTAACKASSNRHLVAVLTLHHEVRYFVMLVVTIEAGSMRSFRS